MSADSDVRETLPLKEARDLMDSLHTSNAAAFREWFGRNKSFSNSFNSVYGYPVTMAAMAGHVEAVRAFLDHGADINWTDKHHQMSSLIAASKYCMEDCASLLIERGADVNSKDKAGRTALHHAFGWGHISIARKLIKAGADIWAADKKGETPLDFMRDSFNRLTEEVMNELTQIHHEARRVRNLTQLERALKRKGLRP